MPAVASALLLSLLPIPGPAPSALAGARFPGTVHGIIISTHGDGRDWADDEMIPTMRELKSLGADWVAIHPYAGIRADGSVVPWRLDGSDPPASVVRPIEIAHSLGLKILIKPHLAYWGSPFDWRGEIDFEQEEQWSRFFADYERWIVSLAGVAREADGFVVGTELDRTVSHEAEWRRIIARVRSRSAAPLTYAANWSHFGTVPFWDALDAIGIHAYFPLTEEPGAGEAALRQGWQRWMERLAALSRKLDRPILFAELGYSESTRAPVAPWEGGRNGGPAASEVQARCLRVALEAVRDEPSVIGAFLWKWFPDPRPAGRNFRLTTPSMRRVIRESWTPTPPE